MTAEALLFWVLALLAALGFATLLSLLAYSIYASRRRA